MFGFAGFSVASRRAARRSGNLPPSVNAGSDQSVSTGATVNLSASASDPDGTISSYAWTQVSGTDITASLTGASTANASFTAPGSAATIVMRCTVVDNLGAPSFDDVQITVTAAASGSVPNRPTNVAPDSVTTTTITLSWEDPTTNVDGSAVTLASPGHKVRWGDTIGQQDIGGASEIAGRVASVAVGTKTYTIIGLTTGTDYQVTVTAFNASGESQVSIERTMRTA